MMRMFMGHSAPRRKEFMSRRTLSGALLLAIVASLVVLPGQAEASPPPPQVQYFERAVLEEHPQNFNRDGNRFYVLGRLLGNELIKGREGEAPFQPVPQIPTNADQTWFPQT